MLYPSFVAITASNKMVIIIKHSLLDAFATLSYSVAIMKDYSNYRPMGSVKNNAFTNAG